MSNSIAPSSLRRLLIAAAAAALPNVAAAGPGWYLGIEGGINFADAQDFDLYNVSILVPDGTRLGVVELEDGWIGGLVAGYSFANGFRPELALDYRRNDFESLRRDPVGIFPGQQTDDVGGHETVATALLNVWYDFFPSSRWHPYIGAGLGAARIEVKNGRFDSTDLDSDADTVFAYQYGAGLGIDLGERWTLSLDYRRLELDEGKFDLQPTNPNSYIKAEYSADTAMIGLRYSFGDRTVEAPPPPEPPVEVVPVEPVAELPPPPPAPACQPYADGQPLNLEGCQVGDSVVLHGVNFDFDQATLTANAKSLLDLVADALNTHTGIEIEIAGHTDGKGRADYNQQLSEHRAESVRQYLIGKAVASERMTARGFGASMPIADNATDEGRELNRRVELRVTNAATPAP